MFVVSLWESECVTVLMVVQGGRVNDVVTVVNGFVTVFVGKTHGGEVLFFNGSFEGWRWGVVWSGGVGGLKKGLKCWSKEDSMWCIGGSGYGGKEIERIDQGGWGLSWRRGGRRHGCVRYRWWEGKSLKIEKKKKEMCYETKTFERISRNERVGFKVWVVFGFFQNGKTFFPIFLVIH